MKRPSSLKQPSFHDIRAKIAALQRVDLVNANVDELVRRLETLLRGYVIASPVLMPGQRLFRSVPWETRPSERDKLSYPPPDRITTFQRANRPHVSRFYCSVAAPATIFEQKPTAGGRFAVSEWQVTEKLAVMNVGFHRGVLDRIGSRRPTPNWQSRPIPGETPGNRALHRFLAEEFSRDVEDPNEYKLSAAIAEKLAGTIHDMPDVGPRRNQIAGLLYPALTMRGDADNLVLLPEAVDASLRFCTVRYVEVDEKFGDTGFQVTTIDFANSLTPSGKILWLSDEPGGLPSGNRTMRIDIEDDVWVARDLNGKILDRH